MNSLKAFEKRPKLALAGFHKWLGLRYRLYKRELFI
jgi:hypothetical protein